MSRGLDAVLWRLHDDLTTRLRDVRDARKAVVHALRAVREGFGAEEAAIALSIPGRGNAEVILTIPPGSRWEIALLGQYLRGERPGIPADCLLAPVERRGRNWAVLALRDRRLIFTAEHVYGLRAIAQLLSATVKDLDENRAREVRRKLENKLVNRQDPKDLMYDILHGLRSLTRYDHSASILIAEEDHRALKLVAEQIAWTKARSKRIGLRLELDDSLRNEIGRSGVRLCEPGEGGWTCTPSTSTTEVPRLLNHGTSHGTEVPDELSMLWAPILGPDGALGVLKLSGRRRTVLGRYEAGLVDDFMPLASLAIQFSVRTESLRARMLQSERKHALANLARGIAHDVNNSLGAVLPLVQQLNADAEHERIETATLREDLGYIERSIQVCRRIFGGMLAISRGHGRTVGHGNTRRAIEAALSVLTDSMRRKSITVCSELPEQLPAVKGGQGDLTQLFLNLFSNATDAMSDDGTLTVRARTDGDAVGVEIVDTGHGIPTPLVDRITESFYTTKGEGRGLGLSICRSILWDVGGEMRIDSRPGQGTRVSLLLPVLETKPAEPAE